MASGEALRTVSSSFVTAALAVAAPLMAEHLTRTRIQLAGWRFVATVRATAACPLPSRSLPGPVVVQVAGWLGVDAGEVDDVMEKEGLNPEFEAGRTQGLGLGAKFLPHSKVSMLAPPSFLAFVCCFS